jgi:hypothetical protein
MHSRTAIDLIMSPVAGLLRTLLRGGHTSALHIGVGISGVSCDIKAMWYRACGEELGWS